MGVNHQTNYFVGPNVKIEEMLHSIFCNTYLTDLTTYHAYGSINNLGEITAAIGFHESIEDASWYWNQVRTLGKNAADIKLILDAVMTHNEAQGRLKFYSMFPKRYIKTYRKLAFSKVNSERYDYFDEFEVSAKTMCKFTLPWQILFNRTLLPTDVVVRCTFLKQQYRNHLPQCGRI
jgi:hypothetical protein